MNKDIGVENYLNKHKKWSRSLRLLRSLLLSFDVEENIKWGSPVYSWQEKNIIGLSALKAYVGLWFFQGALLQDESDVLVNAQKSKTRGMRQWRFSAFEEIERNQAIIKTYIAEAIKNQEEGKIIKPRRDLPITIPPELLLVLNQNTLLKPKLSDSKIWHLNLF